MDLTSQINIGFDATTTMGTIARVMSPRLLRSMSSTAIGMNDSYYIPSHSAVPSLGLDSPTPCEILEVAFAAARASNPVKTVDIGSYS
nr:hypothetical protein CFP56_78586 [Quercus suber]